MIIFVSSCSNDSEDFSGDGLFILYVSNESKQIKTVDIKVSVDNVEILDDTLYNIEFSPENLTEPMRLKYEINLKGGKHNFHAFTNLGDEILDKEFTISQDTIWGSLDYCYPPCNTDPTNKFLFFTQTYALLSI